MRKVVAVLLAILCIALGGVYYWLNKQEDKVAPVITFPDGAELIYQENGDTAILLEGVKAEDDVDGDVSNTLVVESVLPMQNGVQATVLYYAKDKSNNVAKATRVVEYRPMDGIAWMSEPETEAASEKGAEAESETSGTTEEITDLPESHPRIYLTTDKVTVKQGEDYNLLSYVKDITDDKDGPDWLYYQIHIAGMNNINGPGVYELVYTVIDREYNMSNEAKLILTVEP